MAAPWGELCARRVRAGAAALADGYPPGDPPAWEPPISVPTDLIQGAGLVFAVGLATLGALWAGPAGLSAPAVDGGTDAADAVDAGTDTATSDDGTPTGAGRAAVEPLAPDARIVSLNPVADLILLELVAPERLIAATGYTRTKHPWGFRLGDRPTVASSDAIEVILGHAPDLVIATPYADAAYLARLRESGVRVEDTDAMHGLDSTVAAIDRLGALLGVPERADVLVARLRAQADALDEAVPPDAEVPGLYLSATGGALYGGTAGSSYADLLRLGGVRDLAAEAGHTGWPQYSVEEVLALGPPVVVTVEGGREAICTHEALRVIPACRSEGVLVELDPALAGDPGLGLLEAARRVQAAVHR